MIREHQPTGLPNDLIVGLSSASDGDMKHAAYNDSDDVMANRRNFLRHLGIGMDQTSLIRIDYNSEDYCRYRLAGAADNGVSMESAHNTVPADALATRQPGQALFLPIADCCPLVLADAASPAFMLSHLGRHNVVQQGGRKSVEFLMTALDVEVKNIQAWLGPAVGSATYPLFDFDGRSLQEVIVEQLHSAGLTDAQIEICDVDVAHDERYFSHSQFKKGLRSHDGRFAVAAMRRS
ncbi:MAG TPA: laccase domain-containing protein [Candidatus Saccharimonadales bacterium]|nr:laccase domain-containing protein [Candidatus Saccharimonadales bacterium]